MSERGRRRNPRIKRIKFQFQKIVLHFKSVVTQYMGQLVDLVGLRAPGDSAFFLVFAYVKVFGTGKFSGRASRDLHIFPKKITSFLDVSENRSRNFCKIFDNFSSKILFFSKKKLLISKFDFFKSLMLKTLTSMLKKALYYRVLHSKCFR